MLSSLKSSVQWRLTLKDDRSRTTEKNDLKLGKPATREFLINIQRFFLMTVQPGGNKTNRKKALLAVA